MAIKESSTPGQRVTKDHLSIYKPQVKKNVSTGGQNPAPANVKKLEEVKPAAQRTGGSQKEKVNQPAKQQPTQQQRVDQPDKPQTSPQKQTTQPGKQQTSPQKQTTQPGKQPSEQPVKNQPAKQQQIDQPAKQKTSETKKTSQPKKTNNVKQPKPAKKADTEKPPH